MFHRGPGKVFCIGFNKTGTTSLHRYFCDSGLSSHHGHEWPHWSFDPALKTKFWRWTCYSDGEEAHFRNLEAWFPRSLFLLNTREARPWIRSRIKHVMRHGYPVSHDGSPLSNKFGEMALTFFTDPEAALDKWLLERAIYHQSVRSHFHGRPNFMEFDVTTDEDWESKLDDLLASRGFHVGKRRDGAHIHANARTREAVADGGKLEGYFSLADARIKAFSATHPLD